MYKKENIHMFPSVSEIYGNKCLRTKYKIFDDDRILSLQLNFEINFDINLELIL